MLQLTGSGTAHTCDGMTRRDFLQVGSLGAIGLTLADLAAMEARAAAIGGKPGRDDRSVIMIFNLGAPSQLDTFDPKPEAPSEIRGPFQAIKTASPEIELSEILPKHAAVADKFSMISS